MAFIFVNEVFRSHQIGSYMYEYLEIGTTLERDGTSILQVVQYLKKVVVKLALHVSLFVLFSEKVS